MSVGRRWLPSRLSWRRKKTNAGHCGGLRKLTAAREELTSEVAYHQADKIRPMR